MEKNTTKHLYECGKCGGDIFVTKTNGKISSCNIRRCKSCKHQYYSKGLIRDCIEKPFDFVLNKVGIENLFKDILKGVVLKEKKETFIGVHGSSKGDEIVSKLYFDEWRHEWTSKDRAIEGYIFKKLKPFIKEELIQTI